MIKAYFSDLFKRIKNASKGMKIFLCVITLLYIFMFCISVIPVNYIVLTPGTISNTKFSVDIETDNERGQICTIGVYEHIQPSLLQYWISKLDHKMEIYDYDPKTDLSDDMDTQYGIISKRVSIHNAIIVAYEKAKEVDSSINLIKKYEGVIVGAIYPHAITDLKTDDIIIKVNGEAFTDVDGFLDAVSRHNEDNSIVYTVKRKSGDKYSEIDVNSKLIPEGDRLSLGISVLDYYTVDGENSNPKFSIPDDFTSIGSSGGSLTSLSIYNALISMDITKGLRITGTGTINLDGTIGEIGGVQQKVLTAYLNGADIFFVDAIDYEDAVKAMDKYNIDSEALKIIKVNTFNDMIEALESLGE